MSIAEKLVTVAENQQKVYKAGVMAGSYGGVAHGEVVSLTELAPGAYDVDVKLSSKNLFNNIATTQEKNGLTFTVNADKSVTVNGTAEATTYVTLGEQTFEPNTYYFSGCNGGSSSKYLLFWQTTTGSNMKPNYNGASVYNLTQTETRRIIIGVYKGVTVDNVIFYPMITTYNTTNYTSFVDDVSTATLNALGKNLFPPEALDINNYTYLKSGTYEYLLPEMTPGKYYFSATPGEAPPEGKNVGYFYTYKRAKGSEDWKVDVQIIASHHYVYTPVINIEAGYDYKFWVYTALDRLPLDFFTDIQMEVGEEATSYEPYIEPTSYTPNADGTVEDIEMIYPNMTLMSSIQGVLIDCEYRQDLFEAGLINATEIAMSNSEQTGGYVMTFAGYGWCDDNYRPTRPIRHKGSYNRLYNYSRITDTKVDIDVTLSTSNRSALFDYAQNLKTIRKIITTENHGYSNWFAACSALENITFEGIIGKNIDFKDSKKLSKASIENIVGCLSTTATEETLTLSLTAVDNAFETSSGAADGSTLEEWINLITPKSNSYNGLWTITLV